MTVIDDVLRSRLFWGTRIASTIVAICLIWRDKMTADYLLWTPAEYAPSLLVEGIIIGALITFILGLSAFYEQDKTVARSGGEKLAYGMNYLAKNVVVVIVAGVAALLVSGWYYDTVGATGSLDGYLMIGAVAAFVIGLMGEVGVSKILEAFRDKAKASEARTTSTVTKKEE